MKIKDAVQHMIKQYLWRIIERFTEDIPAKGEMFRLFCGPAAAQ